MTFGSKVYSADMYARLTDNPFSCFDEDHFEFSDSPIYIFA